jgi:hypothetical protein
MKGEELSKALEDYRLRYLPTDDCKIHCMTAEQVKLLWKK